MRIGLEYSGKKPIVALYPARVAAYAHHLLGAPQITAHGRRRVGPTTQGRMSAAYYPDQRAYPAILALLAHTRAVVRRQERRYRTCPASRLPVFQCSAHARWLIGPHVLATASSPTP